MTNGIKTKAMAYLYPESLGKVSVTGEGDFDILKHYGPLCCLFKDGRSYLTLEDVQGIDPSTDPNMKHYMLLAEKGRDWFEDYVLINHYEGSREEFFQMMAQRVDKLNELILKATTAADNANAKADLALKATESASKQTEETAGVTNECLEVIEQANLAINDVRQSQSSCENATRLAVEATNATEDAARRSVELNATLETVIQNGKLETQKMDELYNNVVTLSESLKGNEARRAEAESRREDSERLRQSKEETRETEEQERKFNEEVRGKNEGARGTNETRRSLAEEARVLAESKREENEDLRRQQNDSRETTELTRESNEQTRKSNEETRNSDEAKRKAAEEARVLAESKREDEEALRDKQDKGREANEQARKTSEQSRDANEKNRNTSESGRKTAEDARVKAEQQRELKANELNKAMTTATDETKIATRKALDAAANLIQRDFVKATTEISI